MKITTASMVMMKAFTPPQSKKCLTNENQIISCTIAPMMIAEKPTKRALQAALAIPPITFPRKTVQKASANFAFSFPYYTTQHTCFICVSVGIRLRWC